MSKMIFDIKQVIYESETISKDYPNYEGLYKKLIKDLEELLE